MLPHIDRDTMGNSGNGPESYHGVVVWKVRLCGQLKWPLGRDGK